MISKIVRNNMFKVELSNDSHKRSNAVIVRIFVPGAKHFSALFNLIFDILNKYLIWVRYKLKNYILVIFLSNHFYKQIIIRG